MTLVSMKPGGAAAPHDTECHGGCGLCICLDEEQVEALGLHQHPPAAGAKVGIRALATVRRVTQDVEPGEADEEGEAPHPGVTLELHITDMEVAQGGREAASVLYGAR